jgi:hypothetical protein
VAAVVEGIGNQAAVADNPHANSIRHSHLPPATFRSLGNCQTPRVSTTSRRSKRRRRKFLRAPVSRFT